MLLSVPLKTAGQQSKVENLSNIFEKIRFFWLRLPRLLVVLLAVDLVFGPSSAVYFLNGEISFLVAAMPAILFAPWMLINFSNLHPWDAEPQEYIESRKLKTSINDLRGFTFLSRKYTLFCFWLLFSIYGFYLFVEVVSNLLN
jgi:hypothetical protein